MAISQSELMAITVSVLLLTLVPHTQKPWGGVGCGLQALEDRPAGTSSWQQGGRQRTRSGPLSPGSQSWDWAHWRAVVGFDTLTHSPAQTSSTLTPTNSPLV